MCLQETVSSDFYWSSDSSWHRKGSIFMLCVKTVEQHKHCSRHSESVIKVPLKTCFDLVRINPAWEPKLCKAYESYGQTVTAMSPTCTTLWWSYASAATTPTSSMVLHPNMNSVFCSCWVSITLFLCTFRSIALQKGDGNDKILNKRKKIL